MRPTSTAPDRHGWPWPLIFCIAAVVLLDNVAVWLGGAFFRQFRIQDGIWIGSIFGQASFAVMLCGLSGRTWLAGWMQTYLFVMAVVASIYINLSLRVDAFPSDIWSMLTTLPLIALGAMAPLAGARSFWGWSLTRRSKIEIARVEHRVEDLFFFSIAVACAVTIANLFALPGSNPQHAIIGTMMLSVYSFLLVLPVTAITFRTNTWWQRYLVYLGVTCVALSTFLLGIWLVVSYPSHLMTEVLYTVPLFALTWIVGNEAVLASGFRLTHYAPRAKAVQHDAADPFDTSDEQVTAALSDEWLARRQARGVTTAVAAITIAMVAISFYSDQRRTAKFRQLARPAEYFQAAVESIDLEVDEIAGVKMASYATDKDLQQVARLKPNIKRLSLVGYQLSAGSIKLLRSFPKLEQLDLSGSLITNEGLSELPELRSLSLARTRVSFADAMRIAQQMGLESLDVSDTGITDEELEAAADIKHRLDTLLLAQNPISDKGVAKLLTNIDGIRRLDLSYTQVDGSCLDSCSFVREVNLDGTQVNDVTLGKLLKNPSLNYKVFSLRRTQVTAAILPALDGRSVRLGHGQITEADLMNLSTTPPIKFDQLGLNGPQFTGASLPKRLFHASVIDLRGSSVSDDILKDFDKVNWLSALRLGDTQITPRGLENLNTTELDLRGSRITGADLRKLQLEYRYSRILMRHEACEPEEIVPLRKKRVMFDQSSIWPEW